MSMQRCSRCGLYRGPLSFKTEKDVQNIPPRVCKPCYFRRSYLQVEKERSERRKLVRDLRTILEIVKSHQTGDPFVYILETDWGIKIGFSRNVGKRIAQMSTAWAVPCRLIAVAPGGRQLEKTLHNRYDAARIREWFSLRIRERLLREFTKIPGAMVFLEGYVTAEAPSVAVVTGPHVT